MHRDATGTTAPLEVNTTPGSPFTVTACISQSPRFLLNTPARNRGHFFGSGMTMFFASRGCRTHASIRVFTWPGFLPTRCRHPVGS
jgi:hypothetical protein